MLTRRLGMQLLSNVAESFKVTQFQCREISLRQLESYLIVGHETELNVKPKQTIESQKRK